MASLSNEASTFHQMCASAWRRLFYLLLLLSILFETSAFQTAHGPQRRLQLQRWLQKRVCIFGKSCWMGQPRSGSLQRQRAEAEAACCRAIPHYCSRSAPVVLHLRAACLSRPRRPNELSWCPWLPAGTQTLAMLWQVWRRRRQRRSALMEEKLPTRSPACFLFK